MAHLLQQFLRSISAFSATGSAVLRAGSYDTDGGSQGVGHWCLMEQQLGANPAMTRGRRASWMGERGDMPRDTDAVQRVDVRPTDAHRLTMHENGAAGPTARSGLSSIIAA
jgi:hypothetical protein